MALVSEHGLPALIGPNSRSLSNQAYHAPEVKDSIGNNGQKADVYSFGVVLLELLTGKNPACNDGVDLSRWVRSFAYTEWMATVVDTDLIGKQPVRKGRKMDAILDLLKLAMDCCITDADLRPDMNKVERLITQIRRS
ncbi:probable inactive receptor kinase At4g23740 [Oryza brachyantha]|nr:probable inactive receptor kinase At4g23740 [Oryza brachyantha]